MLNAIKCNISNVVKNITFIGDQVDNIDVLNNIDLPSLTCLTSQTCDPFFGIESLGMKARMLLKICLDLNWQKAYLNLSLRRIIFAVLFNLVRRLKHLSKLKKLLARPSHFKLSIGIYLAPRKLQEFVEKICVFYCWWFLIIYTGNIYCS